jgi:glycosyltransferase involved in cell wall biosynthesis
MACGVPQIMTDFSTADELIKKPASGLTAKVKAMLTTPLVADQALIDAESLADCMVKLYTDKDFYKVCSDNAVKFAKNFDWSNIIPMWQELIDSFKDEVVDKLMEDKD